MPRVVFWYRIFCVALSLFNLSLATVCIWFLIKGDVLANSVVSAGTIRIVGAVCLPMAVLLVVGNLWLVTRKASNRSWAFHLSNIAVGICTVVLTPFALILLLMWFQPVVREYYAPATSEPNTFPDSS